MLQCFVAPTAVRQTDSERLRVLALGAPSRARFLARRRGRATTRPSAVRGRAGRRRAVGEVSPAVGEQVILHQGRSSGRACSTPTATTAAMCSLRHAAARFEAEASSALRQVTDDVASARRARRRPPRDRRRFSCSGRRRRGWPVGTRWTAWRPSPPRQRADAVVWRGLCRLPLRSARTALTVEPAAWSWLASRRAGHPLSEMRGARVAALLVETLLADAPAPRGFQGRMSSSMAGQHPVRGLFVLYHDPRPARRRRRGALPAIVARGWLLAHMAGCSLA